MDRLMATTATARHKGWGLPTYISSRVRSYSSLKMPRHQLETHMPNTCRQLIVPGPSTLVEAKRIAVPRSSFANPCEMYLARCHSKLSRRVPSTTCNLQRKAMAATEQARHRGTAQQGRGKAGVHGGGPKESRRTQAKMPMVFAAHSRKAGSGDAVQEMMPVPYAPSLLAGHKVDSSIPHRTH